ncbi:MAG TPA: glycosyltransferase family 2 protein [Planctomycetota bacterium]|jgi:glycosyltransferase involved in cell wall biosynthesis|nr:glycosyltransferase family 2 protein [Planctomycetota bacterium]
MWSSRRVSVILPTYNEKDSIRKCIEGFFATGYVDEVIVVNNNAVPGTSDEVRGTGAIELTEPRQGYGWACRKGLEVATGDFLILSEPDGTFEPRDVLKLLAYCDDFPYVLGTRTTRQFIWAGANMGWLLRWGNWAVAKLIEVLFNGSILTDVGCTMRLLHRDALRRVSGAFSVGGSHFGPHLTLLCIAARIPFAEVSVNYRPRVGISSVTGSLWKAALLGLRMTGMVLSFRARTLLSPRDPRIVPYPTPLPALEPARTAARASAAAPSDPALSAASSRSLFQSRREALRKELEPTT